MLKILGINDAITDSGVAYCEGNKLVTAVSEERFTRKKVQGGFPEQALAYFAKEHKKDLPRIDKIVIAGILTPTLITRIFGRIEKIDKYEKKKNPLFATILDFVEYKMKLTTRLRPESWPVNIIKKISEIALRKRLPRELKNKPIVFVEHHLAHVCAAFYSSGFEEALVASFDGFGDSYSGKIYLAKNRKTERLFTADALDSFGLFYSLVTVFLGLKEHKHEGKVTGLAAFGDSTKIKTKFPFELSQDMKLKYTGLHGKKGLKSLKKELAGHKKEDIAAWLQENTEKSVCKIIQHFLRKTGQKNVCLAGGLFANVKLNQKIHEMKEVDNIYIYPAMSDTGIPHGAVCAILKEKSRLESVFLGPKYSEQEIEKTLKEYKLTYQKTDNIEKEMANILARGKIIARFEGGMEYGPRALGNRSILVQATDRKINDVLGKKLKRTEFMPFAPIILEEFAKEYIQNLKGAEFTSKFMNISFPVTEKMAKTCPAAVHVDKTARPQIISEQDNPGCYKILEEYCKKTGIPVLINTSFNVHEEPIVMTPEQAIKSFLNTGLDCLAMGNYLITKQ